MRSLLLFQTCTLCAALAAFAQVRDPQEMFAAAVAAQQQGKLQEAADLYRLLLAGSPGRVDALSNLGLIYGQLGSYDKARDLFTRALKISPGQTNVRLNLAMTCLQSRQYASARTEAQRVLTNEPSSTIARYVLGVSLLKMNDLAGGIGQLEILLRERPDDVRAASTLASAYMKAGEMEKAGALVMGVLSRSDTADAHSVIGAYDLLRADARGAVAELQRAQELNPALTYSRSALAEANALLGNLDPAKHYFLARVQSNPNDVEANAFLGWLFLENGEQDQARRFLERAHALRPQDAAIDFQRARLARAQGDYLKALGLLEAVVRTQPENAPAHVLLAETFMKLKRIEDAKREREIVSQLNAQLQARQAVAAHVQ
jgi:cellulose synthase operon protein C